MFLFWENESWTLSALLRVATIATTWPNVFTILTTGVGFYHPWLEYPQVNYVLVQIFVCWLLRCLCFLKTVVTQLNQTERNSILALSIPLGFRFSPKRVCDSALGHCPEKKKMKSILLSSTPLDDCIKGHFSLTCLSFYRWERLSPKSGRDQRP